MFGCRKNRQGHRASNLCWKSFALNSIALVLTCFTDSQCTADSGTSSMTYEWFFIAIFSPKSGLIFHLIRWDLFFFVDWQSKVNDEMFLFFSSDRKLFTSSRLTRIPSLYEYVVRTYNRLFFRHELYFFGCFRFNSRRIRECVVCEFGENPHTKKPSNHPVLGTTSDFPFITEKLRYHYFSVRF